MGFSYSDDPLDHFCDDSKAAEDNLIFVERFLNLYPGYKGRPTWFTGESYGGVYVPTLTARALADSSAQIYKQLQGIMVRRGAHFRRVSCSCSGSGGQRCVQLRKRHHRQPDANLLLVSRGKVETVPLLTCTIRHGLVSYSIFSQFVANGCLGDSGSDCDSLFNAAQVA